MNKKTTINERGHRSQFCRIFTCYVCERLGVKKKKKKTDRKRTKNNRSVEVQMCFLFKNDYMSEIKFELYVLHKL